MDIKNRTNPRNGLCLNALHDRAFDRRMITVGEDLRIIVSSKIKQLNDAGIRPLILDMGALISAPVLKKGFHFSRFSIPFKINHLSV